MRKRLEVKMDGAEYHDLQRMAKQQGLTVSQLVRVAIGSLRRSEQQRTRLRKLAVVRSAVRHSFETGDIDLVLVDVTRGRAAEIA